MEQEIKDLGVDFYCVSGENRSTNPFKILALPKSYAKIIKTVRRVAQSEKNDLLERVAQRVADELFLEFDKIQSLIITLKKPEAPIKADFQYVAVTIERSRK